MLFIAAYLEGVIPAAHAFLSLRPGNLKLNINLRIVILVDLYLGDLEYLAKFVL